MTILALIFLVVATIAVVYLSRGWPAPWPWVATGVLVLLWILAFIYVAGLDSGFLGQRIGDLMPPGSALLVT